jgi:hypothetical protein
MHRWSGPRQPQDLADSLYRLQKTALNVASSFGRNWPFLLQRELRTNHFVSYLNKSAFIYPSTGAAGSVYFLLYTYTKFCTNNGV